MKLTKDPCLNKPTRKLVWGFMELLKAGALPCSIQDVEKIHKDIVNKALLTCLIDEFEKQRIEGNASKKNIWKLRDKMAVQHQATFKQVVEINEKTEQTTTYNQKMRTILIQINDLLEHLKQSLLNRLEADMANNKALQKVVADTSEIRVQLKTLDLCRKIPNHTTTDPNDIEVDSTERKAVNPTINVYLQTQIPDMDLDPTEGKADNPIIIPSQTQPIEGKADNPVNICSQTPSQPTILKRWPPHPSVEDVADNGNTQVPGGKKKPPQAMIPETPRWKPTVIPDPQEDAECLLGTPPTVESDSQETSPQDPLTAHDKRPAIQNLVELG